jgi:hypothetical protein
VIVVRGHLGFGDCIHQRAIVRSLHERDGGTVVLGTFYTAMYRDLREEGWLKLQAIPGHPPRVQDAEVFRSDAVPFDVLHSAPRCRMRYDAATVHRHGSILAAQYACCGLKMPDKPDFSLPVPLAWRTLLLQKINSGKPIMVYRPLVLNDLFCCEQRLPDVDAYAALYRSIRENYFVVSVANLGNYNERIVGPEMDIDLKFHYGELSGEQLIGLFAEADLVFTCAGYAPVLAQAVGTPVAVVYGGHEGFKTTNAVGAHLAPTLAIECVNQCECHGGHYTRGPGGVLVKPVRDHDCDKTLDVQAAIKRLHTFVEERAHADA